MSIRSSRLLGLLGFSAVLLAGTAGAAPLNWEGTSVSKLAAFPTVVITGGGVATINDSSGVIPAHLNTVRFAGSRGGLSTSFTQFVTDPDTIGNGVFAIQYENVGGGTGTYGPISGGGPLTQNVLPIPGVVRVCLVNTSCAFFLPLVLTEVTANGAKVGAGIGGALTIGADSPIRISIEAAPWTINNITVIDEITTTGGLQSNMTVKVGGFVHDPGSGTSSTAAIGGVLQVVTANQVRTNLPLGSNANQASTFQVTYRFIPEPGLLLLLGTGVAGLVALGRRRMRR